MNRRNLIKSALLGICLSFLPESLMPSAGEVEEDDGIPVAIRSEEFQSVTYNRAIFVPDDDGTFLLKYPNETIRGNLHWLTP